MLEFYLNYNKNFALSASDLDVTAGYSLAALQQQGTQLRA